MQCINCMIVTCVAYSLGNNYVAVIDFLNKEGYVQVQCIDLH